MYQYKQDLAMAYFPDNSKETASKRFANEIHSNKPLLAALQATGYSRPRKIHSPKQYRGSQFSILNSNRAEASF